MGITSDSDEEFTPIEAIPGGGKKGFKRVACTATQILQRMLSETVSDN